MKERKRKETKTTVKFITYTSLADDSCPDVQESPQHFITMDIIIVNVFQVDQLSSEGCLFVFIVLNLHNKHAMKQFLLKCFCSCLIFIQRFYKVAVLYQSITKIRAKAKEEGKCEMKFMTIT